MRPRGSSPLTRGKRSHARDQTQVDGLIPAHAGKTRVRERTRSVRQAHPRSRGENFQAELEMIQEHGSSPLTRGKLTDETNTLHTAGLIPAHAGKTLEWV